MLFYLLINSFKKEILDFFNSKPDWLVLFFSTLNVRHSSQPCKAVSVADQSHAHEEKCSAEHISASLWFPGCWVLNIIQNHRQLQSEETHVQ